jgi:hypothetical protein
LDLLVGLEGRVFASLDHADAVTAHYPLFPIFSQLCLAGVELAFSELARGHVGMEFLVCLQLRDGISDNVVNILELISVCFRVQEDCSVWEGIQGSEDDVEGREIVEACLQDVKGLWEEGSVYEREAEIDVGLPANESWIVLLSNRLNLLIAVFHCEGQGCVVEQLWVFDGLHQDAINLVISFIRLRI